MGWTWWLSALSLPSIAKPLFKERREAYSRNLKRQMVEMGVAIKLALSSINYVLTSTSLSEPFNKNHPLYIGF